jgi:predicted Zn finger-like uncharacterized protein
MSTLITSCPSCGVRFKLVPDQLKVSDGWVRCGQCREIFDASARIEQPASSSIRQVPLLTEEWAPPAEQALEASPPVASPSTDRAPSPAAAPADAVSEPAATKDGNAPPALALALALALDPAYRADLASPDVPGIATSSLKPEAAPPTPTQSTQPEALNANQDIDIVVDEPVDDSHKAAIGFIRDAQRQARWRRPWVRLCLGLSALIFLLSLAAQVVYTDRSRLATVYPQTQALIASICSAMNCEVSPYQDLEAVVIEGTKFQKLTNDNTIEAFELDLMLKSKVAYPVAWPALELSLTNSQDQVVLRKVLLPQQYAQSDVFPAQSERNIRTAIQIQPQALPSKISGFRVLLFYP